MPDGQPYEMKISRTIIEKLGVKLYDKVSAVLAELVANSYDADAKVVNVYAPMNKFLARKEDGEVNDLGDEIVISDNGSGMTPKELQKYYLIVGGERRDDERGGVSPIFERKVMGRKGVGKLAPFGICKKIEIISSGGEKTRGKDKDGNDAEGFMTSHIILDSTAIIAHTEEPYHPNVGPLDERISPETGTTIKLKDFSISRRKVSEIDTLERQLAQRFGIKSENWSIKLINSQLDEGTTGREKIVGEFLVEKLAQTEIRFIDGKAVNLNGEDVSGVEAYFEVDDVKHSLKGWVAYSKEPYKDDLMAGVRIYCRKKIAAQTAVFNMKAGFTGEYDIRSYVIGELHADWLDEDDDLILTDRRDILWSHEIGQAFQEWGQSLIKTLGRLSREPRKIRVWDIFKQQVDFDATVSRQFPGEDLAHMRSHAEKFAKFIAKNLNEEELKNHEYLNELKDLAISISPQMSLEESLNVITEETASSYEVLIKLLKNARIAEAMSFGRIARKRVDVIGKLETLKDDPDTEEKDLQALIATSPWLVNPEWTPITDNRAFNTFKSEFAKYFEQKTGVALDSVPGDASKKRPDFIFDGNRGILEIVEIKKPSHSLTDEEMQRILYYYEWMEKFINEFGNEDFVRFYNKFHITVICDGEKLTGAFKVSFDALVSQDKMKALNWRAFWGTTLQVHIEFIAASERHEV